MPVFYLKLDILVSFSPTQYCKTIFINVSLCDCSFFSQSQRKNVNRITLNTQHDLIIYNPSIRVCSAGGTTMNVLNPHCSRFLFRHGSQDEFTDTIFWPSLYRRKCKVSPALAPYCLGVLGDDVTSCLEQELLCSPGSELPVDNQFVLPSEGQSVQSDSDIAVQQEDSSELLSCLV